MIELSICIPVYNRDISELYQSLLKQIKKSPTVELIFIDDASTNKTLAYENKERVVTSSIQLIAELQ